MIVKNTQHIIFKYQFTFSDKGCKSCRGVQKARSKSNRHTEKTYEKTQLLTDIHSRMVECENGFLQEVQLKRDKVEKEKTTAKEHIDKIPTRKIPKKRKKLCWKTKIGCTAKHAKSNGTANENAEYMNSNCFLCTNVFCNNSNFAQDKIRDKEKATKPKYIA
jgi:hypothetical protein